MCLRGRSGVFGGSGSVPYIVQCVGSPWLRVMASAAACFAAAASGGRRGVLPALPLALVLFRVAAAPKFANGTERRWRFRLSPASAARASLLPEYSCRAWRRFREIRRLPTVHWRRSFIDARRRRCSAGAGGTTLSDIVRGRIRRRIARTNANLLVKPRRVVKKQC